MKTRFSILFILILALGMLLSRGMVQAATITVTTNNDINDTGVACDLVTIASLPGPDGVTSLREAMCAANNNAGADTINFNITGCGGVCTIQPTSLLPVLIDDNTTIDGYTQPGASPADGDTPATVYIEIDGRGILNNGLNITSSGNVIRGLAIYGFSLNEVFITSDTGIANNNIIAGNYLGTLAGAWACPAEIGLSGVFIGEGAQDNTIGGDAPAERNVIGCNGWDGVSIHKTNTTGNVVSGNYIGVGPAGVTPIQNSLNGVRIYGGAQDNIVGGDTAGERNIISGNYKNGVRIQGVDTTGNVVSGNYIGTDASGTGAIANHENGMIIDNAPGNLVGGDTPGERNVISGNVSHGIYISGGGSNEITSNYIGPDSSGIAALPNGHSGVMIESSGNNTVGGDDYTEVNIISGNAWGIWIQGPGATGNWIHGNAIGVGADMQPMGNTNDGVHFSLDAQQNTVGRDAVDNGNINFIAYNGGDGVGVDSGTAFGNAISKNTIFQNDGMGIHLTNGSNNLIEPPIILTAPNGPGDVTGTAVPGSIVELFVNQDDDGEGMIFIGSTVAGPGPDGDFTLDVPYLPFPFLTATTTDLVDGTSEFSDVYTAMVPVLHMGAVKSVDRDTVYPGDLFSYTITFTNTGTAAAAATLTDTLSSNLNWMGNYSVTSGELTWESADHTILWDDTVDVGEKVVITFEVQAKESLVDGVYIYNIAEIENGAGYIFEEHSRRVTVVVRTLFLPIVIH